MSRLGTERLGVWLVESMVDVCRDLNIRVVAEGVETQEELDALVKIECELFQGYLFARPTVSIQ